MPEDLARERGATFVEVIPATDAPLAIDRFKARRRAMAERGERHPERDVAAANVEAFILDAVDRLTRLPSARLGARIVPVALEESEEEIYHRLLSALDETARLPPRRASREGTTCGVRTGCRSPGVRGGPSSPAAGGSAP